MFRLSVITDEVSQSLPEVVAFAKKYGLTGLEIRSINGRNPFAFTPGDEREIEAAVRDTGLALCSLALPLYKCGLHDEAAHKEHLQALERSIRLAGACGCKLLRGFTFWNEGGDIPFEQIVKAYQPVIEMLDKADMTVILEAEPSVYTANAAKLAAVLEAIDSPRVQAVWDGANLLYDPQGEAPVPDGYNILKKWIRHVHIKDAVRNAQGADSVPVGKGEADIPGQLRLLKQDGYDGWLSLETHYRRVALDEERMRQPTGYDFSEGGLEASEESMENLQEILRGIA